MTAYMTYNALYDYDYTIDFARLILLRNNKFNSDLFEGIFS